MSRSAIELEARQADQAAADATRALHLLQAETTPGSHSCFLGRAYLTLGRALQAQGKSEEARAAFRSAAQHLQDTVGSNNPETRSALQMAEQKP